MFIHQFKPSEEYNRLLLALGLQQTPENDRTYANELITLLGIRMSQLSDCIRRGCVTGPVLEAAKAKGINPEFIKKGSLPIHLGESSSIGNHPIFSSSYK